MAFATSVATWLTSCQVSWRTRGRTLHQSNREEARPICLLALRHGASTIAKRCPNRSPLCMIGVAVPDKIIFRLFKLNSFHAAGSSATRLRWTQSECIEAVARQVLKSAQLQLRWNDSKAHTRKYVRGVFGRSGCCGYLKQDEAINVLLVHK